MIKADYDFRPIKKKELAMIALPEIDNFTATLKSIIFDSGVSEVAGMKIVTSGGLSLLEGLLEKMETDIGLTVKMGIIKGAAALPISKVPSYAGAIGLLYMNKDVHNKIGFNLKAQGKNKLTRLIDYVSNLYQDYF